MKSHRYGQHLLRLLFIFLILSLVGLALAQDADPAPADAPIVRQQAAPLTLSSVSPQQIVAGSNATLTLTGSGFQATVSVLLDGVGQIPSQFVNETTLTATVPASVGSGTYDVTLLDEGGATANLPSALTIVAPTPTPRPISVSRSEPAMMTSGQLSTLSVFGSDFTSGSVVRLVGIGLLPTTFVNSSALTATLPGTLLPGVYGVEVSDPVGGTVSSPNMLTIIAPPPPSPTPPTLPTPQPVTLQPALGVDRFSVSPEAIAPGQAAQLNFTVVNRGNQVARMITVALGANSGFVMAGDRATIAVPDLNPGAAYGAQMVISAGLDISDGPVGVPLVINYQDVRGESYSATAQLGLVVEAPGSGAQIVVDAYTIDPAPADPGGTVIVQMTVANLGSTPANQVAVRVNSGDGVLLPNGRGDTFSVGDLAPGERLPLRIPLLLSADADAGPQVQSLTFSYVQNGESQTSNASLTVSVAEVQTLRPLLLLTEYDTGEEVLTPGMRFTLAMTLQNAGDAPARTTTVTFGTVQSEGGGDNGNPNNGPSGGSGSTTPSTVFAPLGTAGLVYVGDLAAGSSASTEQSFIVSGGVSSGIYSLPVTLQYLLTDGTSRQETLNLSLIVLVPPRLRFNPPNPLPETANMGEPLPVSLEVQNVGRNALELTGASFSATNAEILDGSELPLESLESDDSTNLSAVLMPLAEGPVEITMTLNFSDGLGQPESITQTYTLEAVMPPPPIDVPMDEPPVVVEPEPEPDWFGRLLMALLGLGS